MTRDEIIRGLRACSHQQPECRDKCPLWMSDCVSHKRARAGQRKRAQLSHKT